MWHIEWHSRHFVCKNAFIWNTSKSRSVEKFWKMQIKKNLKIKIKKSFWDILPLLLLSFAVVRSLSMSDSLWLHGHCSLPGSFCPWDFSDKNTGVGCYFFLQGIFLTQGLNLVSYIDRQILYHWVTREAQYSY